MQLADAAREVSQQLTHVELELGQLQESTETKLQESTNKVTRIDQERVAQQHAHEKEKKQASADIAQLEQEAAELREQLKSARHEKIDALRRKDDEHASRVRELNAVLEQERHQHSTALSERDEQQRAQGRVLGAAAREKGRTDEIAESLRQAMSDLEQRFKQRGEERNSQLQMAREQVTELGAQLHAATQTVADTKQAIGR